MIPPDLIDDIIRREGSEYTNRPTDRGGPTKYGITQKTLADHRGTPVTPADVEHLTEAEARKIYWFRYYLQPHFDQIHDPALSTLMVDSGIQHGTTRVVKWLQTIVGTKTDGVLGPQTISAVNSYGSYNIYKLFLKHRIQFYGEIIEADHTQAVYARGWLSRVSEFIDAL